MGIQEISRSPVVSGLAFLFASGLFVPGCGKAPSGFTVGQASLGECNVGSTTKSVRILVMVDNSGSTAGTDPDQSYRVQTLRDFLDRYGGHSNLSYGFGYFDDDASLYDFGSGSFGTGSVSTPFGGVSGVSTALDTYHASIPPAGNTAYRSAFSALRSAIEKDEAGGATGDYSVVFMSDGQPTDIGSNVPATISGLVDDLRSSAESNGKSRLSVSAVYFGSESDSASIENLRGMAERGGGQFVDTNLSGGLSIDDVVTVPGC